MTAATQVLGQLSKFSRFSAPLFNAYKTSCYGRNFSVPAAGQERVVYVYRSKQPDFKITSVNENFLLQEFRKHTNTVKFIERKELGDCVVSPQKAVLVIYGNRLSALTTELQDFVTIIRDRIKSGSWNYLGVDSGAIFASHGLKRGDQIEVNNSYLRLANFATSGFPQLRAREFFKDNSILISVRYDNEYRIRVNSGSGPSLEITQGEKVEDIMKDSTIEKIGEYSDRFFTKSLGYAALLGTSGKGRYFVQTHAVEQDDEMDCLNEAIEELCLEDVACYVNDKPRLNAECKI